MEKLTEFVNDFVEGVESDLNMLSDTLTQNEIKELMVNGLSNEFPMVSYEYTPDTSFEVDIDESKFLNDEVHNGAWVMIENMCLINFMEINGNVLEIDAFEMSENYRNSGYARKILNEIEHVSGQYYEKIKVTPFDDDAQNFWEHFNYKNYKGYDGLYKEIG